MTCPCMPRPGGLVTNISLLALFEEVYACVRGTKDPSSMNSIFEKTAEVSKTYPKPNVKFSYGTAGFRTRAETLESVMFRMGLLSVLRSKAKGGQVIGVVITASHNPVHDNGVKLVDPLGEMLEESWEKYASSLANSEDVTAELKKIALQTCTDMTAAANVFIARDTRPSGPGLAKALMDGIQALGGIYHDYGILSTPQLHYMVRCHNTGGAYGDATENGYYKKLSKAFLHLKSLSGDGKAAEIKLDGANGVGALKAKELLPHLLGSLPITVYNDGLHGKLNERCGADYVKINQCVPDGMTVNPGDKCVVFDGDADRVMYFFVDEEKNFCLLDGDKIATLIAGHIKEKLDLAGLQLGGGLGIVQTAYANGSATSYVQDVLKVPVACAKTGVKHLHHKAEQFDIGVYFEANGHGTFLIKQEAENKIRAIVKDPESDPESKRHKAAEQLLALVDLINQAVGDAISDMLVVEAILYEKGWGLLEWYNTYTDLPNRQKKVKVQDRSVIKTTESEREATAPEGLQAEIDKLVAKYSQARSFVRPSGTEDIVRVYAEADTQEAADSLALAVCQKVYDMAGGVGGRP